MMANLFDMAKRRLQKAAPTAPKVTVCPVCLDERKWECNTMAYCASCKEVLNGQRPGPADEAGEDGHR